MALLLGASVIGYLVHSVPVPALRPWQTVFVVVGIPGLLVSLWTLTLREPVRQCAAGGSAPPLAMVLTYLRSQIRALGSVYLCMAFAAMTSYSANAWMVSMLIRTFGSTTAEAGHSYGLVVSSLFGFAGLSHYRGSRAALMHAGPAAGLPGQPQYRQ